MIDRRTGAIRFDEPGALITEQTTRSAFLAANVWKHEPFMAYSFKAGEFHALGRRFIVIAEFDGERLSGVDLVDVDPKYGSSWHDWSETKELQRKASHDAALEEDLGRHRRFGWGTVGSFYDQRSGGSQISIRYGAVSRKPIPFALAGLVAALLCAGAATVSTTSALIAAALLVLGSLALGLHWR